jgi:hypothetical protein
MTSQPPGNPKDSIRVMQIINASLVMGVVMLLGVVIVLTQDKQPKEPEIAYFALGFLAVGILVSSVLRVPINKDRVIPKDQPFDPNSEEVFLTLAQTYQTERIIKLAIIEGGAFFNGVAYMTEKAWWSLAAMGLAILLMLVGFPTRSQINAWIERRTLGLQFGDSEY